MRETYSSIEYREQLKSTGTGRSWLNERERQREVYTQVYVRKTEGEERVSWERSVKGSLGVSRQIESKNSLLY